MWHYRLKCPCGFESNSAGYGRDLFTSPDFFVPVVVDGDEKLHHICVKPREGESEEAFLERLQSSIEECFALQFGENATLMTGLGIRGDQIVKCPRCGQEQAKFAFAGW